MNYFDVCIIGGGINGVGIAAEASARGLSVLLCEQQDLASATSSMSSKLIHGGLRYLEYYEFRLVREALKERETLMKIAPHLIRPLEFILPYHQEERPFWLMRLGLWLYDHLYCSQTLPHSKKVFFNPNDKIYNLQARFTKGFSYYDAMVDDARLVIENALLAKNQGATILSYHQVIKVEWIKSQWYVTYKNIYTAEIFQIACKILVNASGPWVEKNIKTFHLSSSSSLKLVKGSHIIVPRFYEGEHAYILQNIDHRIVFTIPYSQKFTLIGTTDVEVSTEFEKETVSFDEKLYLCQVVNRYFNIFLKPQDIIHEFWGVRPLLNQQKENLAAVTRDYHLEFILKDEKSALLNIFGGKITTYRALSEKSVNLFKKIFFNLPASNMSRKILPGGDFNFKERVLFIKEMQEKYNFLNETIIHRYVNTYGSRITDLLQGINNLPQMGRWFTQQLSELEILFLKNTEWVNSTEDLLWRRTKIGLTISDSELTSLKLFFQEL